MGHDTRGLKTARGVRRVDCVSSSLQVLARVWGTRVDIGSGGLDVYLRRGAGGIKWVESGDMMWGRADGKGCLRRQLRGRTPLGVVGCQAGRGVAGRQVAVGVLEYRSMWG